MLTHSLKFSEPPHSMKSLINSFGRLFIDESGDENLRLASAQDVKFYYQVILGRDPESDAVIEDHLRAKSSARDVMGRIYDSPEAEQRRMREAVCTLNRQRLGLSIDVEVDATPLYQAKLMDHIKGVWSKYGQNDAYYSVLTDPKYKMNNIDASEIEEFYASGEVACALFDAALGRHALPSDKFDHVLELGCGVGRVGASLARKSKAYTGVDISPGHIALAAQRFSQLGFDDGSFVTLSNYLDKPVTYDLFYSILVLQHNPPPIIYFLLDVFLRDLRVGGVAYFQVPSLIPGYSFETNRYLEDNGKQDSMEVHAFPEQEVFKLFTKHNIQLIESKADTDIENLGFSNTYLGRKISVSAVN